MRVLQLVCVPAASMRNKMKKEGTKKKNRDMKTMSKKMQQLADNDGRELAVGLLCSLIGLLYSLIGLFPGLS